MNTLKRKLTAILLTFAMLFSLMPALPQAAEAADGEMDSRQNDYIKFEYQTPYIDDDNEDLEIKVIDASSNRQLGETITINNYGRVLADTGKENVITVLQPERYEIESVGFSGGVLTDWLNITFDKAIFDLTIAKKQTITIVLRAASEKPNVPEEIVGDTPSRIYRIYDDQVLKMLHFANVAVSEKTKIKSVTPNWVYSFPMDETELIKANREQDYRHNTFTSDSSFVDEVQPKNIQSLTIEYDNGNGTESKTISAKDLRFVIGQGDETTFYKIELNNDEIYIVYFVDPGDGLGQTDFQPYAVRFVNAGESLGNDQMPLDPVYGDGSKYKFVCWEISSWNGDGDVLLSTTPINDDMTVFAHKVSTSSIGGTRIRVMNENGVLINRIVELYNAANEPQITADQIDIDSVRISITDTEGNETNMNYVGNDWKSGYEYFQILNYTGEGVVDEDSPYYTEHVAYDKLDKAYINFELNDKTAGNVMIPICGSTDGIYGGLAKQMNAYDETILELRLVEPPEAPTAPDLEGDNSEILGAGSVKVECTTNEEHEDGSYALLPDSYDIDTVYWAGSYENDDGAYFVDITVNDDAYVTKYNDSNGAHTITGNDTQTITLKWTGSAWTPVTPLPVIFKVTCENAKNITEFNKEVLTQDEIKTADITGTYDNPTEKDGKVVVKEGESATLLYKITVKGTPGTNVTVTDDGTTLVEAVGLANIGPNSPYEFKLRDTGEATLYVSKTFTNIQKDEQAQDQQTLDNTATIANNDNEDKIPGDGTTEENVPVDVEPVSAFVKTVITTGDIDTLPEDLKTRTDIVFPTKNEDGSIEQVVVPQGGSVTLLYAIKVEGGDGDKFTVKDTGADLVYAGASDVTEDTANDTFSGTIDKSGSVQFYVIRTFSSDEVKDQKLTNSATLTSEDIDLEPGEEEQEEEVPATTEDLQVVVTPANVTIYEGGKGGYDGVGEGASNSTSLPHPMFYIEAPEGVDPAGLTFVNGDKVWTVVEDGLDGNAKNPRMLYHFEQGAHQDPVRVTYTYVDANGNETTVLSDNLDADVFNDVADVYTYLRIDLYADENNLDDVRASFNGKSYAITTGSGRLTVRAVEADDPNIVTRDIRETAPTTDEGTAVAVEPENTTYTLNNTDVELPEDSQPSLLFDNIINDDGVNRTDALENKADQKLNANDGDYNYEIMYLDLVDANNGNAWITSSEGTDIYWDYPEDTDINTNFEILHFTGLHRENSETTGSGFAIEDLEDISMDEIENVTIKEKTDEYIVFHVEEANFSPYAIAWETDNGGSDTPGGDTPGGNDPWYPPYNPGDDDKPSGLNTEDHFSYVVGYEDGMVKPQRSITRAEVATIFYRLLEDDVRDDYDTTRNNFSDVTSDSWYNQTVSTLASMGILKGYEDGTFRPNASITRAEFAAIATRFFEETGATYEPGTFTDVTGDEWFAGAIMGAVNLGLIGGYEDGTVRPNNNITRAEACAIVNRTLGRVPDADHLLPADEMTTWPDNPSSAWFYADMQEATNGHEYEWITEDGNKIEEWTDILDKDWNDR